MAIHVVHDHLDNAQGPIPTLSILAVGEVSILNLRTVVNQHLNCRWETSPQDLRHMADQVRPLSEDPLNRFSSRTETAAPQGDAPCVLLDALLLYYKTVDRILGTEGDPTAEDQAAYTKVQEKVASLLKP